MAKYIDIPFATNGNKNAIPDTTTDGTVNYNDGFGADYAKPIGTDPSAKSVDRQTINQVLYDYGSAIQQLQENGFYPWQSTKAGGYDIGAVVSYSGANYINTVAGNTNAPDVSGWTQIAKFSDFTSGKTTNGYQLMPSDDPSSKAPLILQWGISASIGVKSDLQITLPISFSFGMLNVTTTFANTSTDITADTVLIGQIRNFSLSTITIRNLSSTTAGQFFWQAIGY